MRTIIGRCPQCGHVETFSDKDALFKKITGLLCYRLGCGHYAVIGMSNNPEEVELKAAQIVDGTLFLLQTEEQRKNIASHVEEYDTRIFDPRDGQLKESANPALILRNMLSIENSRPVPNRVDEIICDLANYCDSKGYSLDQCCDAG